MADQITPDRSVRCKCVFLGFRRQIYYKRKWGSSARRTGLQYYRSFAPDVVFKLVESDESVPFDLYNIDGIGQLDIDDTSQL